MLSKWNGVLGCGLALAALLSFGAVSSASAQLVNGGFESPDASGGDVAGSDGWNSFNFVFTTAAIAHSGTQSLKTFGPFGPGGGSGAVQALNEKLSVGYGFTAIIVAFLGRLNPLGVIVAGFVLALTYLGGEAAQISLQISDKTARVFQGMLLFFVLASDTLIHYRVRIVRGAGEVNRA